MMAEAYKEFNEKRKKHKNNAGGSAPADCKKFGSPVLEQSDDDSLKDVDSIGTNSRGTRGSAKVGKGQSAEADVSVHSITDLDDGESASVEIMEMSMREGGGGDPASDNESDGGTDSSEDDVPFYSDDEEIDAGGTDSSEDAQEAIRRAEEDVRLMEEERVKEMEYYHLIKEKMANFEAGIGSNNSNTGQQVSQERNDDVPFYSDDEKIDAGGTDSSKDAQEATRRARLMEEERVKEMEYYRLIKEKMANFETGTGSNNSNAGQEVSQE